MDGHEEALQANLIAEYMFSNVNEEGNRQLLLDVIIDHCNIPSKTCQYVDSLITSKNGQQRRKPTTAGWDILMKWKDGSITWVTLKECKESFTVQLAEYAQLRHLVHEPAFAWWISHVLKKK